MEKTGEQADVTPTPTPVPTATPEPTPQPIPEPEKKDGKKISVKAPKLKMVKRKKGQKKVKAYWTKVKGVSGYQIQFSTSKKFKKSKTKTFKVNKKRKKAAFKKLKKNKKYFVRIRAYKKVNGKKYYSEWSNVKKLKK